MRGLFWAIIARPIIQLFWQINKLLILVLLWEVFERIGRSWYFHSKWGKLIEELADIQVIVFIYCSAKVPWHELRVTRSFLLLKALVICLLLLGFLDRRNEHFVVGLIIHPINTLQLYFESFLDPEPYYLRELFMILPNELILRLLLHVWGASHYEILGTVSISCHFFHLSPHGVVSSRSILLFRLFGFPATYCILIFEEEPSSLLIEDDEVWHPMQDNIDLIEVFAKWHGFGLFTPFLKSFGEVCRSVLCCELSNERLLPLTVCVSAFPVIWQLISGNSTERTERYPLHPTLLCVISLSLSKVDNRLLFFFCHRFDILCQPPSFWVLIA